MLLIRPNFEKIRRITRSSVFDDKPKTPKTLLGVGLSRSISSLASRSILRLRWRRDGTGDRRSR
jgi:hypothetical protein